MKSRFIPLLLLLGIHSALALKPNGFISDNMVLQRDMPATIWGTGEPGETVTVEFSGQKKTGVADGTGRWSVLLYPMPASAEPREMTISSKNPQTEGGIFKIRNVLVGEVWLCAGQSNMEWALARSKGGTEAIAGATNPLLRIGHVPHNVQMSPQTDVNVKWEETTPAGARYDSAVPYWFGEKLQRELRVPVGIISAAFGGTPIESWLSKETLSKGPWPHDVWNILELAKAAYDKKAEAVRPIREKYEVDKAVAVAQKQPAPTPPPGLPSEFKGATTIWNGEVHPMLPLRIRGVAWYQGENNGVLAVSERYKDLLPALIREWRNGFGQPDLPFIVIQLSRFRKWQVDPNETSSLAEIREAQMKTVRAFPHAALVVTLDLGEPDVHYLVKEPVGERTMKAALAIAYGCNVNYSGPIYSEMKIKDGKVILYFDHAAGLTAPGGSPAGFVIAGDDRKFYFADARIEGETVTVFSRQVPKPAAVRYGWADLPWVNLFNREGLPCSTFRTDDWPLHKEPGGR